MHIDSQFVGTPLKKFQSRITWRDTMNYAAAIKDGNPGKLKEIYCRFTGMVQPGSEIRLKVYGGKNGIKAGDLFFDVINHEGQKAISHGYVRFSY